jgi:aspartyl-tRNA(Asn)/glutamyl-tRNA(Gln) amidotransferase subunit A
LVTHPNGHSNLAPVARIPDWSTLDAALRRKISATAVERARRLEPRLNAFVALEEDLVPIEGHLGGLPYAAKDMFRTPSRRPTGGLAIPSDAAIDGETDLLARLDGAGARRVGFTGLPELAYEPSGYNHARGRVRNPWNLDFIAGGSSSGSAAAVASGSAVVALGSDTAGSLRIPAHCCGITAWKPTYGVVATTGAMPLAPTLDTIGLLARSVCDMREAVDLFIADDAPSAGGTIAHTRVITDCFSLAEQPVRQACMQGVDCIEASGTRVDAHAALADIDAVDAHALVILQAEAARIHRVRAQDPDIPAVLRKRLAKGFAIDEATLATSIAMRETLSHDFIARVFGGADAIILPVMAMRVPRAVATDPAADEFSPATLYALSRLTRFVNMLGFPAIAIPVGFDDRGLPVALQIVGRPRTDLALLALGQGVQDRSDWHARIPDAVADAVTDSTRL